MTVMPTIRHQLLEAAERNAAAAAPTLGWRRSIRWLPRPLVLASSHLITATLVAVTVVVAVGAIILLGHGRHSQVADRSEATTSRQQLLQTLGVLRTSPTATDRRVNACVTRFAPKPGLHKCLHHIPEVILITERPAPVARSFIASFGNPRWDLKLIRTVPLGRSGEGVTLFPGAWRPIVEGPQPGVVSSPPSAKRTWGVVAAFVDHGYADSLPTSGATLRAHGLVLFISGRPSSYTRFAIIVPDGVARITIGKLSLDAGHSYRLENVTAAVHHNVTTVKLKTSGGPTFAHPVLQVSWFDSQGHIIKRTTMGSES
jgi:hypothetical protein